MIARQLISHEILPLKTSDSGTDALNQMDEFKVLHLPIVNNETFLGLISEQDIYDLNNADEPLGNHKLSLEHAFVEENQHVYDVLKLVHKFGLTIIPVLDDRSKYLGAITSKKLLGFLASTFSVENPGMVIVLEMSQIDYSLAEISKIAESNNTKILSVFLLSQPDSTRIDVVLKLNKVDIGAMLQTFDRYGYSVKSTFGEQEDMEDLRERYDSLMNYLKF